MFFEHPSPTIKGKREILNKDTMVSLVRKECDHQMWFII